MQTLDNLAEDGSFEAGHLLNSKQVIGFPEHGVHEDSFSALSLQLKMQRQKNDHFVIHEALEHLYGLRVEKV